MLRNVFNKLKTNLLRFDLNKTILEFKNHNMTEIPQLALDLASETDPTNDSELKKGKKPKFDKQERKIQLKIRRQAKKEVKPVGFYNETLTQTDYYFENGLRKVYPYFFFWNTTSKERWFGRTLYEVYSQEFARAIVSQDLEKLISSGKIKVNNKITSRDYKIKNGILQGSFPLLINTLILYKKKVTEFHMRNIDTKYQF